MGLYENFPYTNFQNLNLDWLMRATKENQDAVKNLNATIETTVDNKIQELLDSGTLVPEETPRKILFIGDSYMVGAWATPEGIQKRVRDTINCTYLSYAESTAGWVRQGVNGHNFADLMTIANEENDLSDITDVVIMGGLNDFLLEEQTPGSVTNSTIQDGLNVISAIIKSHIVKCNTHAVIFPYVCKGITNEMWVMATTLFNNIRLYGFNCSQMAYTWLRGIANTSANDGQNYQHPNNNGQKFIGNYISRMIQGDNEAMRQNYYNISLPTRGDYIYAIQRNGVIYFDCLLTVPESTSGGYLYTSLPAEMRPDREIYLYGRTGTNEAVFSYAPNGKFTLAIASPATAYRVCGCAPAYLNSTGLPQQ